MLTIIDYSMGNLHSVGNALDRLGVPYTVSASPEAIKNADGLILPGVGAFPDAVRCLKEKGLFGPIRARAAAGTPLLGICLGMQLLFETGLEHMPGPSACAYLLRRGNPRRGQGDGEGLRDAVPPRKEPRRRFETAFQFLQNDRERRDAEMIILPAIDLLGGNCVRLVRGAYDTASKVAADALETARAFQKAGAEYLHMVDLDGARDGRASRLNRDTTLAVAKALDIPVELGGGIRRLEDIEELLNGGVSRVILGSAAADADFLARAAAAYGGRLAVGVDARNGRVAFNGWTQDSGEDYIAFASRAVDLGVRNIIFTDIDCDGTLSHPNFGQLEALSRAVDADITASGGIADITDIEKLAAMGMYGAICGKSIYAGTLDLAAAIKAGRDHAE